MVVHVAFHGVMLHHTKDATAKIWSWWLFACNDDVSTQQMELRHAVEKLREDMFFFWGWTFESKRTTYRSLWSKDVFRRMKLPKGLPGWVVADFVFTDFSFDVFFVSGGLLFRTDCKGDRKGKYLKLKHGTYKGPTRSGQTCVVALHLPRKIANEPLKQDEVFQLCTHIFDSMFMNV